MDQQAPAPPSGHIRGLVVTVPGNRRIPQALVRFFELRPNAHGHREQASDADWILEKGAPVGSCITNERGEFSIAYCPPKGETSLAFIVLGPETGTACDILSWSCDPRHLATSGEVFLIGVSESRLAAQRQSVEPEAIGRLIKAAQQRRIDLAARKPKPLADRLAKLVWNKAARNGGGHGFYIDESLGAGAAQKLNEKLIREAHKSDKKGPRIRAIPVAVSSGGIDKKLQRLNKLTLGLTAVNTHSEVTDIVNQLRPLIRARQELRAIEEQKAEKARAAQPAAPVQAAAANVKVKRSNSRRRPFSRAGSTATNTRTRAAGAHTGRVKRQR